MSTPRLNFSAFVRSRQRLLQEASRVTDLPPLLVFKRITTRLLLPNRIVAEYHCDQIKQTIIFPNTFRDNE